MRRQLQVGLLGAGALTREFGPALRLRELRVAAVFDADAELTASIASDYGGALVYSCADELLSHPGLQAIFAGGRGSAKYGWAASSMERGIPVMLAPPLAVDTDAIHALCANAESLKAACVPAYGWRFEQAFNQMRSLITAAPVDAEVELRSSCGVVKHVAAGRLLHTLERALDIGMWLMAGAVSVSADVRMTAGVVASAGIIVRSRRGIWVHRAFAQPEGSEETWTALGPGIAAKITLERGLYRFVNLRNNVSDPEKPDRRYTTATERLLHHFALVAAERTHPELTLHHARTAADLLQAVVRSAGDRVKVLVNL